MCLFWFLFVWYPIVASIGLSFMLQFMLCCIALLFWVIGALSIASRFAFFPASFSLVEDCFLLLVLFAGFTFYCWLVASGFWLLGPLSWALWEFSLLGSLFWFRAACWGSLDAVPVVPL